MQRITIMLLWILAAGASLPAPSSAAELHAMLPNGLQVLVRERPDEPLVAVHVAYAAGSFAEPDSLAGLAHLAEHILAGDPDLNRQTALLAFASNAYTSPSEMAFWCECLPAFLPRLLDVEARRMAGVRPDSATFARERSVVLEECAYRTGSRETSPRTAAFRAGFPGHPYGRATIGTPESIAQVTRDDLTRFIARTIQPGAAALVIDGPVDATEVLARVEAGFGALPAGPTPEPLPDYPAPEARQTIFDDRDHKGLRGAAAVRAPLATERDVVLAQLAADYLATRFTSTDLTMIPGEAVVTYAWLSDYFQPRPEYQRRFDPDLDAQGSLAWSWGLIHAAADDLVDPEERDELTRWLTEDVKRRQESSLSRATAASALLTGAPLPGPEAYAELAAEVGLADLHAFIAANFLPELASVAISHGRDSQRLAARPMAGRVDREHDVAADDPLADLTAADIDPVLRAYRDADLLHLETLHLANGIPVVCQILPDEDELHLAGWRWFDPLRADLDERPELVLLYNQCVGFDPKSAGRDRPPRPWPHDGNFILSPDGTYVFTAHEQRGRAAALAASLVERLETDKLNTRSWAQTLDAAELFLPRMARNATMRARAWRLTRVLGADQPQVRMMRPDPDVLRKVKYKHVCKLHEKVARPTGQTTLLAVGGVSTDALRTLLEATFGERDDHETWSPADPPPGPDAIAGKVFTLAGETDVTLVLTFPAVALDPSWPEPGVLLPLAEQLGGLMLQSRLRHQEGWTYASSFDLHLTSGWIVPEIAVTCQPGQAPAVLQVIRDEIAGWGPDACTADRLALARLKLTARLLRSSGDTDDMLAWLVPMTAHGPAPADPVAAVLDLDPAAAGLDLSALVPVGRFVFTATGAIFEDDLEQFEF